MKRENREGEKITSNISVFFTFNSSLYIIFVKWDSLKYRNIIYWTMLTKHILGKTFFFLNQCKKKHFLAKWIIICLEPKVAENDSRLEFSAILVSSLPSFWSFFWRCENKESISVSGIAFCHICNKKTGSNLVLTQLNFLKVEFCLMLFYVPYTY